MRREEVSRAERAGFSVVLANEGLGLSLVMDRATIPGINALGIIYVDDCSIKELPPFSFLTNLTYNYTKSENHPRIKSFPKGETETCFLPLR
jgi:hypothetical protein